MSAVARARAAAERAIVEVRTAVSTRAGAAAGQGLAEYALILALILIVAVVALIFLGGQVKTIISSSGTSV